MAWASIVSGTANTARLLPDESYVSTAAPEEGCSWVYTAYSQVDLMAVIGRTRWVNNSDISAGNGEITLNNAPETFAIKPGYRRATRKI